SKIPAGAGTSAPLLQAVGLRPPVHHSGVSLNSVPLGLTAVPEHRFTQPRKWYPNRVERLRQYLSQFFRPTPGISEEQGAAIVNNVAYTLQYLQFLAKLIADLDLTAVLATQTFKAFIINGCAVVEAIFYQF